MSKQNQEVGLNDYEKLLIKGNMEEEQDSPQVAEKYRQCLRIMKDDYNAFIEKYPKRTEDIIVIERRIAYMEKKLKIKTDDYGELDKYINDFKVHKKQEKLHLCLMDLQNVLFRAEKMNLLDIKKQYKKQFDSTQAQYNDVIKKLKDADAKYAAAEQAKDFPAMLSAIQIMQENAPKVGKEDEYAKYKQIAADLEAKYLTEQKEAAEADKLRRQKEAEEREHLEEERRAKEAEERKQLEEAEKKMREAQDAKRKAEEDAKRKAEEGRIQKEEEALLGSKVETVNNKLNVVESESKLEKPLGKMNASQVQAMNLAQVQGLDATQLSSMKDEQRMNLTPKQLGNFTPDQLQALSLEGMSSDQILALSLKQIQALTKPQIQALSKAQLSQLEPEHWQAFTAEQITWFTPEQLGYLDTETLDNFTPEQIQSLTNEQLDVVFPKLSDDQLQFLTVKQIQYLLTSFTPERLKVLPQEQVKKLDSIKCKGADEWVQWTTMIPKSLSKELLGQGGKLVDSGKIKKLNRYLITRYALSNLKDM